jgi:hypothetical protein
MMPSGSPRVVGRRDGVLGLLRTDRAENEICRPRRFAGRRLKRTDSNDRRHREPASVRDGKSTLAWLIREFLVSLRQRGLL